MDEGLSSTACINAFEVILGSRDEAVQVMYDLRELEAESPFDPATLRKLAHQMLAFGFDDVIAKLRVIQEMVLAIGKSEAELVVIVEAFNRIKAVGRVTVQDLRMMETAGVDALQQLTDATGVTVATMFERVRYGKVYAEFATETLLRGVEV